MDETTEPPRAITLNATGTSAPVAPALALIWSRDEPHRAGELLMIPEAEPRSWEPQRPRATEAWTFGRDAGRASRRTLGLVRQRPGVAEPTGPLACPRISRAQLRLSITAAGALLVENVGRCPLVRDDLEVSRAELAPLDIIELRHEMVFLCVSRPRALAALSHGSMKIHPFGAPDAFGLVGESPSVWELRRAALLLAERPAHVLVRGPSGSGKELVARAIHAASPRAQRQLVARNAATLPEGLVDAELFGSAKGYPNPGSPERPGLVGEADGGTLFLDELAELPQSIQAHLLRVLDAGEYHRLGEARARRADLRLVAATNRPEEALKHDILARLQARIEVPGLDARREDIPLLAAHAIRRLAAETPARFARFFPNDDIQAAPRTTPELMKALVRHPYQTHVRELDAMLLQATVESAGKYVELTKSVHRAIRDAAVFATRSQALSAEDVGPIEGLSPDEQRRVALFQKHAFNIAACARDPEYRASRQAADLHLRQLMARALAIASWDVPRAVALLAGPDEASRTTIQSRIEGFVLNLRHRLDAEGGEALRRSLKSEWRASAPSALRLVEALETKRLQG